MQTPLRRPLTHLAMYDGKSYDGSKVSEVPYILEFSSFLLRQLIVTLSIPKDLMQSYREVLWFMIGLVKKQQSGAKFEAKSNILYPLIRGIFHYPRDTKNSRGGECPLILFYCHLLSLVRRCANDKMTATSPQLILLSNQVLNQSTLSLLMTFSGLLG